MPTRKPRMALTLSDESAAALTELSEVTGRPAASIAAELLHEVVPQLEGLAKIARAAKTGNKAAAKRALTHMLGDSLADVMATQQPDLYGKGRKR